jgi:hypothetical protein
VERQRQAEVDGGLPKRIVARVVVVGLAGKARHHHAAQPEVLHLAQILDALGGVAHRRLADAEQAIAVRLAVLGDPQVVGVEARLHEVAVLVVADRHADGGVEDLAGDPVALLIVQPSFGIPAAAMQLLELDAEHGQLFGALPGGGDHSHRDRVLHPRDHEDVAELVVAHDVRRSIAKHGIDARRISIRRLGDVGVGGDDFTVHGYPPKRSDRCARI